MLARHCSLGMCGALDLFKRCVLQVTEFGGAKFLVFLEQMETTKVYIRDSTTMTAYPLMCVNLNGCSALEHTCIYPPRHFHSNPQPSLKRCRVHRLVSRSSCEEKTRWTINPACALAGWRPTPLQAPAASAPYTIHHHPPHPTPTRPSASSRVFRACISDAAAMGDCSWRVHGCRLFGGSLQICSVGGFGCGDADAEVSVGDGRWIRFRTSRVIASLIQTVRRA
eukprot:COSAG01_NODE_383_length_17798_cov_351.422058_10_plen_224_part_00